MTITFEFVSNISFRACQVDSVATNIRSFFSSPLSWIFDDGSSYPHNDINPPCMFRSFSIFSASFCDKFSMNPTPVQILYLSKILLRLWKGLSLSSNRGQDKGHQISPYTSPVHPSRQLVLSQLHKKDLYYKTLLRFVFDWCVCFD